MKKFVITLLATALAGAAGCSKHEAAEPADEPGRIALSHRTDCDLDTRAVSTPAAGDFALRITGPDYDRTWERVSDFSAEETFFAPGTYTATLSWGDPEAEGTDVRAFYGQTRFDIVPRRTTPVAITARIVHSAVTVRATEAFMRYFHDAHFTVTTASGNTFDFAPDAATLTETTAGRVTAADPVYVKAATSLTVIGRALRQTGTAVTFAEQRLASTTARTCHVFTFDAPDAGSASLEIYLGEEYVETRLLPVVELNDGAIPDHE